MGDYIERDAVTQMINKWADGYSYIEVTTDWAEDEVRKLPAADVAPVKRGRWKYTPAYKGAEFGFYNCSSCGSAYWWNTSRYCPDCGAKMNRGAEDD